MAHGWSMRETGGFVAAGLPVSAGGLMPRTALLLVGRAGRGRGKYATTACRSAALQNPASLGRTSQACRVSHDYQG